MKIIDTEAHFYTRAYHDYLLTRTEIPREEVYKGYVRIWYHPNAWEPHGAMIEDKLMDLAKGRLNDMDEAGIDMQVLSLSAPGCEQFGLVDGVVWARKTNDTLSKIINKYPDRFIGMAALAPQSPENAALELERTIKQLGFKGVKLNSNAGGEYLDNRKFWPIFEVAEKLDVPIYLHPSVPTPALATPLADYGFALCGPALGFAIETAVHAMRLIYSGLFEEYPRLKMILGHMGEGLVHWLYRIDYIFKKPSIDEELHYHAKKAPSQYIKNNFFITTSGMSSLPAFLNTYLELGADRIMFSTDYPFESNEESVYFVERLPVSDNDKEKITYINAKKLFKI